MTNPLLLLLRSRKFWIMVLDLIVSLILYFAGRYAGDPLAADIKYVIGVLQPVFLFIIGAIAYEDGQLKRSGRS